MDFFDDPSRYNPCLEYLEQLLKEKAEEGQLLSHHPDGSYALKSSYSQILCTGQIFH
jgi:hypothetical protein